MSLRKFFGFNRLRIGSRSYRLQFPTRSALEGNDAEISYARSKISICRGLSETNAAMSFLHELFHGILEDRLAVPQMKIKDADEERIVDALSRGFLEVLIANPEFQKWLGRYRP